VRKKSIPEKEEIFSASEDEGELLAWGMVICGYLLKLLN
jgi:hypothetical protein